jgi:hypothetical protein
MSVISRSDLYNTDTTAGMSLTVANAYAMADAMFAERIK